MKTSFDHITEAYQKEIALHQELLECLSRERDHLVDLNLENLWSLMEEKTRILKSIEETRETIKAHRDEQQRTQESSSEVRRIVTSFSGKIDRLKGEIRARVRENVSFIQDTLGFLDEMISIFITGAQPAPVYNPVRKGRHESANLIYHREV